MQQCSHVMDMHRPGISGASLAMLVVVAGCSGILGTPTPTPTSTPSTQSGSDASSLQELDNATLWIDGRITRIENTTVYIDDQPYSDVVIPVLVAENSVVFSCGTGNTTGGDCTTVSVTELQPGAEVCVFVYVRNGTLQVGKLFVHSVCGGPQPSPG
ncbi:MAG: hypothetical protein ABEI52_03285 [Halobacteriaceae archaeon]